LTPPFADIRPKHFPWFDYSRYTFSLGLQWSGHAWLSGHSAGVYDGEEGHFVVRGGMADQTRTAYEKIAAILDAAGYSLGDAQKVIHWVTQEGLPHAEEADAVRAEILGESAKAAVGTCAVRRLLRPQAWIEIEVVAGDGAGDLVYLPGLTGVPAGADALDQLRAALDDAGMRLAAAGARAAKAVVTVTPGVDMEKVLATLGGGIDGATRAVPAATVNAVPSLRDPRASVAVDLIGTPEETAAHGEERAGIPDAIQAGRYLFCSGAGARTGATGSPADQARAAFAHLEAVLGAAGAANHNMLKTVEYVTIDGLADYRPVAGVRADLFDAPYPASTGLVCDALPADGQTFEVDATALLS
jgi:enamine deaminase RidA (YjgF/YER057c/UK114 family)